jgi:hypothetical protein
VVAVKMAAAAAAQASSFIELVNRSMLVFIQYLLAQVALLVIMILILYQVLQEFPRVAEAVYPILMGLLLMAAEVALIVTMVALLHQAVQAAAVVVVQTHNSTQEELYY